MYPCCFEDIHSDYLFYAIDSNTPNRVIVYSEAYTSELNQDVHILQVDTRQLRQYGGYNRAKKILSKQNLTKNKIWPREAQKIGCGLAQLSIKTKPFRLSHYHISLKVLHAKGKMTRRTVKQGDG